jgi:mono/diheme cytochrome c family protein
MWRKSAVTAAALTVGLAMATTGLAQGGDPGQASTGMTTVSGGDLFRSYCAACHGTDARGNGPIASSLRTPPADLTLIAQRNEGIFPTDLVYQIVDGRKPVIGHGGSDMPTWGNAFARSGEGASEESVKARIDALVTFVRSRQRQAPM